MSRRFAVTVESGEKRVFASALDWPGWARGAKTEADALAALVSYGDRYGRVVARSPGGFEAPADVTHLAVVERSRGGAGTDFGVPSNEAEADERPLAGTELERFTAILQAAWRTYDEAAEAAVAVELRTGPRGGGRDLGRMVEHAVGADEAYLTRLGARPPKSSADPAERWPVLRALMLETLAARAGGAQPGNNVKRPWSPRYFVRRAAWHVLDHAWEIEDRSRPGSAADPG